MEQIRMHHFPASDNRAVTGMLPTGRFVAYDPDARPDVRGYGATRMAAIADLNEKACFLSE